MGTCTAPGTWRRAWTNWGKGPGTEEASRIAQAGLEFQGIDGLGEEVVGSGAEGLALQILALPREEPHGDVPPGRVGLDGLAGLEAAHPWQHDIQEHQVDPLLPEKVDGFEGIAGEPHLAPQPGEHLLENPEGHPVVIHHQNSRRWLAGELGGIGG